MRNPLSTGLPERTHWLGLSGLGIVTLAAVGLAGLAGFILGGVLLVGWRRLAPEETFALGQFALIIATPLQQSGLTGRPLLLGLLALGELGLIGLLLSLPDESYSQRQPRGRAAIWLTAGAVVVGLGVGWLGVTTDFSLWLVASGLLVVGGVLVYLVQSYDRWQHAQQSAQKPNTHE